MLRAGNEFTDAGPQFLSRIQVSTRTNATGRVASDCTCDYAASGALYGRVLKLVVDARKHLYRSHPKLHPIEQPIKNWVRSAKTLPYTTIGCNTGAFLPNLLLRGTRRMDSADTVYCFWRSAKGRIGPGNNAIDAHMFWESGRPFRSSANGLNRSSALRIKCPDRELASRQRPAFIAVHGCKPPSHVGKNGCEFLWTPPASIGLIP